jgi:predicted TIM-barrel fold metal-dependent hydrolase
MKKMLLLPLLALLVSCATLNPGADPFVVRVEQTQTGASATFDFLLHLNHANRSFWKTNAPEFHAFAEWLRTPQPYGTNTFARCVVIQLNVDDLKLEYKSAKTAGNSNALYTALAMLKAAVAQCNSWSNIVTSPTHP